MMTEHKLCVACGHEDMAFDTRDLNFEYRGHNTLIPAVSGWYCPHCGEAYLEDGGRYANTISAFVQEIKAGEAT
jgi:HTH-type transcriptional regulator/antitoxin MqsA